MAEKYEKVLGKSDFYSELDSYVKDYKADKELHNMGERRSVTDHEHKFTLVAGNKAECECGWGLFLDNKDEIRDGRLFRAGVLVM